MPELDGILAFEMPNEINEQCACRCGMHVGGDPCMVCCPPPSGGGETGTTTGTTDNSSATNTGFWGDVVYGDATASVSYWYIMGTGWSTGLLIPGSNGVILGLWGAGAAGASLWAGIKHYANKRHRN